MRAIRILLPTTLYTELCEVSAAMDEPGYGPSHYAADVLASELASRRLPRIALGSHGPRMNTKADIEPQIYRVMSPEANR